MTNLIRADLYRILRGKGIYITFTLAAVLSFIVTIVMYLLFSFSRQALEAPEVSAAMSDVGMVEIFLNFSGWDMVSMLFSSSSSMLYFLIPIVFFAAASQFDYGTIKNAVARGVNRTNIYISAMILTGIFVLALFLVYILSGLAFVAMIIGLDDPPMENVLGTLFSVFGFQFLILLAASFVGVFFAFLFRRGVSAVIALVVFYLVTNFAFGIIGNVFPDFRWLLNFEMGTALNRIGSIGVTPSNIMSELAMTNADYIMVLCAVVFYSVVSTVIGLILFRKAEIK